MLILTLWTLFFLSALAVAVGTLVSAAIRVAEDLGRRNTAYYAARAGVEQALRHLRQSTNAWNSAHDWSEEWLDLRVEGTPVSVYWVDAASGGENAVTNAGLSDEEGRISLNMADPGLLRALFIVAGGLSEPAAGELVDCILDWKDADDDRLTFGAERAYYSALSPPYACHNGPFLALEELRLVRGVTGELYDLVAPHATLYGAGKVNVNSAGALALACVGVRWGAEVAVARGLADRIVEFRRAGGVFETAAAADLYRVLNDFRNLTGEQTDLLNRMAPSLQANGAYFRGRVEAGRAGEGQGVARIEFIFDRKHERKVYWHER